MPILTRGRLASLKAAGMAFFCVFHQLANAASSLPCTPPKPPLLITSTWSPARAARRTAATRASSWSKVSRLRAQRGQRLGGVPPRLAP